MQISEAKELLLLLIERRKDEGQAIKIGRIANDVGLQKGDIKRLFRELNLPIPKHPCPPCLEQYKIQPRK